MKYNSKDPGSASDRDLAEYWRMPSTRSARELAKSVGVRRVNGRYLWYSIWKAEGLAPPPRSRWSELKLPHSKVEDVAAILGESTRSARRRGLAKPDASFPDPIPLRKKPMLWRTAQLRAWQAGLPVPHYQQVSARAPSTLGMAKSLQVKTVSSKFDPWGAARSAATESD
jgi:hypothetical protein